jgi:hypothetical protein
MSFRSRGSQQTINQISQRFDTDRYGIDSIEYVVEIPDNRFPQDVLREYATHPRFSNMMLSRRSGSRTKPGWWTVAYVFEGFLFSIPEPTYELNTSLTQEPIQTHPDFSSKIGGTPADPKNGAIFVDPETRKKSEKSNAIFREFSSPPGEGGSSKSGVDSYLVPGAEWRETKFTTSRPNNMRNVGTIDTPNGPAPNVSGKDWLAWSESYLRRGAVYQVATVWKLSGRNGWDTDIYEE